MRLSLPRLLLVLTAAAGLVDAVSYLELGHVFVANLTGNVVFLGFSIGGASGLSTLASLVAIAAFLTGALGGGRLAARSGDDRADVLTRFVGALSPEDERLLGELLQHAEDDTRDDTGDEGLR